MPGVDLRIETESTRHAGPAHGRFDISSSNATGDPSLPPRTDIPFIDEPWVLVTPDSAPRSVPLDLADLTWLRVGPGSRPGAVMRPSRHSRTPAGRPTCTSPTRPHAPSCVPAQVRRSYRQWRSPVPTGLVCGSPPAVAGYPQDPAPAQEPGGRGGGPRASSPSSLNGSATTLRHPGGLGATTARPRTNEAGATIRKETPSALLRGKSRGPDHV